MIVWRGWGVLSIVIAALAIAAAQLATPMPVDVGTFRWRAALALLIGAAVNFWAGWRLNRAPARVVVDSSTGRRFTVRPHHDLFFVPIEYWTLGFVVGAAVLLFAR